MRVPAHLQEIAATLALRSWVDGKKFPQEKYFETIDLARPLLARHGAGNGEPRPELVVMILTTTLDEEGLLLTYVLEKGTYPLDVEDREMRWLRCCQAAAWVILQAYERACKAREWPT